MKILINDKEVVFNKENFPMLINGADKSGASFFSISLLVNLFENREKVLFFSAFDPAKEEFRKQLGDSINGNTLIIESGNEENFIKELDKISDLSDRIVLCKNIENYSSNLFNKLTDQELVIFSGDIDKCEFGEQLVKKDFKTKIFFSYPEKLEVENKIELPKYKGMIISSKYKGIISL
jgi:hypothetical protein